jgi:hypothetical protein
MKIPNITEINTFHFDSRPRGPAGATASFIVTTLSKKRIRARDADTGAQQ